MRQAFKPYPFFEADETPPAAPAGGIDLSEASQEIFKKYATPLILGILTSENSDKAEKTVVNALQTKTPMGQALDVDQQVLDKLAAAIIAKARFLKETGEKKAQEAGKKPNWDESVANALEKPEWYNDVVERAQKKEEEKPAEAGDDRKEGDFKDKGDADTGEEEDKKQEEEPLLRNLSPKDKQVIKGLGNKYAIGIVNGAYTSEKAKTALENDPDLKKIKSEEIRNRIIEVTLHKAVMIFNSNAKLVKQGTTPPARKTLSGEWWENAETDWLNHKNEKKNQLKYFLKNSTPIRIEMEKLTPEKQEELTNYLNTSFPEKNARMLLKTDPIAALGITVYEIETEEDETYQITLYPAKGKGWFTRLPAKLNPKVWLMTNKWATLLVTNLQNWMQKGVLGRNAGESQLRMAIAYSTEKTPQAGLQKIAQIAGVQVPTPQQIASKVKRNVIKGSAKGGIGED